MKNKYKPRERKPVGGWIEGKVRTTIINGEPCFVARDVELALGYGYASNAVRDYCTGEKTYHRFWNGRAFIPMRVINRGELYRLIARCRTKKAMEFSNYLFHVFLPMNANCLPLPFETIDKKEAFALHYPKTTLVA